MAMALSNDVLKNCRHRIAGLALRLLFVIFRGNEYVRNITFHDNEYIRNRATRMSGMATSMYGIKVL